MGLKLHSNRRERALVMAQVVHEAAVLAQMLAVAEAQPDLIIKVNVLRKTRTNRLPATASYTVKTTSWISYQEHTSNQSPGRQYGGAG